MCCDLVVIYCEVVLHDVTVTRPFIALTILIFLVAGAMPAAAALKPARVVARITTGQAPCSENGGLGYLWASNFRDGTVVRIDPATNRVTARIKVGPRPDVPRRQKGYRCDGRQRAARRKRGKGGGEPAPNPSLVAGSI